MPAAKGFRQADTWVVTLVQCGESLLARGVSDIRFTRVWVACCMNAGRHLGEKQTEK